MNIQDTTYGTIPTQVLDVFESKIALGDRYIMYKTGDNTYQLAVKKPWGNDVFEYTVTRHSSGVGYSNYYEIDFEEVSNFSYAVNNEMYVYSNIGYGAQLDIPALSHTQSYAIVGGVCICVLLLLFGRVLAPRWLRSRR